MAGATGMQQGSRSTSGAADPAVGAVVGALVGALAARDPLEGEHNERVVGYARLLATKVEPSLVGDPSVEAGYALHDIGKMALPDATLHRRGPLSARDWRLIHRHTLIGEEMVSATGVLEGAAQVIRSHHERWDGFGYPDKLARDAIPLPARIFAVADALDAITSNRPWRMGRTFEEARKAIAADAGTHFDPDVVAALDALTDAQLEDVRATRH